MSQQEQIEDRYSLGKLLETIDHEKDMEVVVFS